MRRCVLVVVLGLLAVCPQALAESVTNAFPPAEFGESSAPVMEKTGESVVILQGATERPGEAYRYSNTFFYLTGGVQQRAILVGDDNAKRSALFLAPAVSAARACLAQPFPGQRNSKGEQDSVC